jgi:predicted RNase H-like HicB family nuclease
MAELSESVKPVRNVATAALVYRTYISGDKPGQIFVFKNKGGIIVVFVNKNVMPLIFHVTLEKAEDGWIVAECPALPGCVSQGKDEKEALDNIKEAIAGWLWTEDKKAFQAISKKSGKSPIVVAI